MVCDPCGRFVFVIVRYRYECCAGLPYTPHRHWKEPFVAKRSPLGEKLDEVRDRIAAAAVKAKRDPAEVTLVAVTKTAGPEQIRELLQLGITDLGESRVQQLAQRRSGRGVYPAPEIIR